MARVQHKLTVRQVDTLKSSGRHADGGNLYLSINGNGGRRWVFLYRWQGRRMEMGLGSAAKGGVSLADVRGLARQARSQIDRGIDPLLARRAALAAAASAKTVLAAQTVTFGQLADEHIEAMESAWSNDKHRAQWRYTLETLAAELRPRPIADVDTAAVLSVLKPLWLSVPETASRLRGRIEAVLNRAKAKGLRSGENPAAWRGHLELLLPKRQKLTRGHHSALSYDQMAAFMFELRMNASLAARALEFIILTATRTGECIGAQWHEIDREKRVWTIPAVRMKAKVEHRVPLSEPAFAIITQLHKVKTGAFLFPNRSGRSHISNMAMAMVLRRLTPGITVHGMRSSFRDWAAETTSFPHHVCEMALAHAIENKAESAYRRGDLLVKRAKLMQAWAEHCSAKATGSVIPIGRTAAR